MALFFERAVAVVDVEMVRAVEAADVEVEVAIVVDVDEGGAGGPAVGRAEDAGFVGDIFEAEIAEISIQPAAVGRAGQEDIDVAIAVVVAHRHAAAGGVVAELAGALGPGVKEVEANRFGIERFEEMVAGCGGAGGEAGRIRFCRSSLRRRVGLWCGDGCRRLSAASAAGNRGVN